MRLIAAPEPAASADKRLQHVLLVVDGFPAALGGGERAALRLAALLPQHGFRVSILTFSLHPDSSVLQMPPPCPLYLLPLRRTYDGTALRGAWELSHFLEREDVRLVQTFFESSDIWAGAVTRALSSARLVWSRRDMGILREKKHRLAYRWMAGIPHRVFAVSDQVRHYTVEVDGVPPGRVETVYNGLDLRRFAHKRRTLPLQSTAVHITTVGNIRRVKGHDVLIRAAAEVLRRFPVAVFSIAGAVLEPAYRAELDALLEALGLRAQIRFLGPLSDLPAHLASADMFVLPSHSEGFSNAILEAMACGLPVVATAVGGNAEAVLDGQTGLIVPAEDASALAAALCRLLENPEAARRMGELGRERAFAFFSEEAMVEQVVSSYKTLLAN